MIFESIIRRSRTIVCVVMAWVCFSISQTSVAEMMYRVEIPVFEVKFIGVIDLGTLGQVDASLLNVAGGAAFVEVPVAEHTGDGFSRTSLSTFSPNPDGNDLNLDLSSLAVGDTVSLAPRTEGDAGTSGSTTEDSTANSSVMTEGLITVENTTLSLNGNGNSGQNLLAIFDVSWRWEALVRGDNPAFDSSQVSLDISITADSGSSYLSISEDFEAPFNDGQIYSDQANSQFFGVFVGPGQTDQLYLQANVSGLGSSLVIPEPATGVFLGLMMVLCLRRRH